MSEFTPGRWEARIGPRGWFVDRWSEAYGNLPVQVSGLAISEWDEADAHLIAAAPDLYGALERTARWVEHEMDHAGFQRVLVEIGTVLAKARGDDS
jgi:hypothetical protein